MAFLPAKPVFCVILGDGDYWSVEAEWPDGSIELVNKFKSYSEATSWLSTFSEEWLNSRVVPPQLNRAS
jgi:hypothetical protein